MQTSIKHPSTCTKAKPISASDLKNTTRLYTDRREKCTFIVFKKQCKTLGFYSQDSAHIQRRHEFWIYAAWTCACMDWLSPSRYDAVLSVFWLCICCYTNNFFLHNLSLVFHNTVLAVLRMLIMEHMKKVDTSYIMNTVTEVSSCPHIRIAAVYFKEYIVKYPSSQKSQDWNWEMD